MGGVEHIIPNYGCKYLESEPKGCEVDEDLDPREILRKEIQKQLKEEKYYDGLNKKWDKSTYRMKKDQLFRRMQMELDEKAYQDCLCAEERRKCELNDFYCEEKKCAARRLEQKSEEIREGAFLKQFYACSPEIRELERQLRRGYYAKTLYAQRLEGEALKLEEKMRQEESYGMFLEKLSELEELDEEKRRDDFQKKKDYYKALKNQLEDSTSKVAKKEAENAKDKMMIDEIIATIQQEEIQDLVEKTEKVHLYRKEIGNFLEAREHHRQRERIRFKNEDEQIQKYLTSKEAQVAEYKKAKEAQEKAKASIVAKSINRIMQEQFQREEMEELQRELYEEELAADVRRKAEEEKAKKLKQMEELRAAAEEAKRLRDEKIQSEKEDEEEFRKELMKKFAEDERLEQMANQKRRQREREHRKVVEQMIIDRRCLKAQEREKEQKMLDCFGEDSKRREMIINEERLKMLKLHGPKLLGFLPRGSIKSWEEIEKLGEPFISYYKNQPLEPDPSTIDLEPCEEEIFKTMTLPQFAKY